MQNQQYIDACLRACHGMIDPENEIIMLKFLAHILELNEQENKESGHGIRGYTAHEFKQFKSTLKTQ